MLRGALIVAQGLCLLPGLYTTILFARGGSDMVATMLVTSALSVALQGAGTALLSLRKGVGWWLLIVGIVVGIQQGSFGPTPFLQTILNVLPSVLGALLPLAGWLLWLLHNPRTETRDLIGPVVAGLVVFSLALTAWIFARSLPFQGSGAMWRGFLIWLASHAISSVGLILVALRRTEGWWVLLAAALLLLMGQGANMVPMFNVAFPILAALNLIQWRLGEKTSRHGQAAKPIGT